jgi:hypothetical protein
MQQSLKYNEQPGQQELGAVLSGICEIRTNDKHSTVIKPLCVLTSVQLLSSNLDTAAVSPGLNRTRQLPVERA